MDIIYNLRGGGEFRTWETTIYNLIQKLGKIQKWEYGPRVLSLFGGAPCMHSHGLRGFAGVKKITALPSPMRILYSPSPNIVGHNAVTEMAFLLHANTINNEDHSLDSR